MGCAQADSPGFGSFLRSEQIAHLERSPCVKPSDPPTRFESWTYHHQRKRPRITEEALGGDLLCVRWCLVTTARCGCLRIIRGEAPRVARRAPRNQITIDDTCLTIRKRPGTPAHARPQHPPPPGRLIRPMTKTRGPSPSARHAPAARWPNGAPPPKTACRWASTRTRTCCAPPAPRPTPRRSSGPTAPRPKPCPGDRPVSAADGRHPQAASREHNVAAVYTPSLAIRHGMR